MIVDFGTENHKLIVLKCFVDAMPKAKVTWYKVDYIRSLDITHMYMYVYVYKLLYYFQDNVRLKNNEQYKLKHNDQELHIIYVFENDSGTYSCKAENRLGSVEGYQNIIIKGMLLIYSDKLNIKII